MKKMLVFPMILAAGLLMAGCSGESGSTAKKTGDPGPDPAAIDPAKPPVPAGTDPKAVQANPAPNAPAPK